MILDVSCSNLSFILNIVKYLIKIIQFVVPFFLIALVIFDLLKGIIAGDEKSSKETTNKIGKRLLYAVLLFLIPILVRYVFRAIDKVGVEGYGTDNSATSWMTCLFE